MTTPLQPSASSANSPVDEGVPLVTLSRGADLELRIRAKAFKGHRYIDVREWSRRAADQDFWPVKGRGISIKVRELTQVIEALQAALRLPPSAGDQ